MRMPARYATRSPPAARLRGQRVVTSERSASEAMAFYFLHLYLIARPQSNKSLGRAAQAGTPRRRHADYAITPRTADMSVQLQPDAFRHVLLT